MSKPHSPLSIAISVSVLSIWFSCPVLAKPQSPSDPFAPPVEAVLANVKLEASKTANAPARLNLKRKSATKTTPVTRLKQSGRHTNAEPLQGITNFTDPDRVTTRNENYSAINQLIE